MNTVQSLISPIIDILIFYKILRQKIIKKDYIFISCFITLSFLLLYSNIFVTDYPPDLIEVVVLFSYIYFVKKDKNIKKILGSLLLLELFDLIISIITNIINVTFPNIDNNTIYSVLIMLELVFATAISIYSENLHILITNQNSTIFIGILIYIYLSSSVTYFFAYTNRSLSEDFQVSLGLLIFQSIFAILLYVGMVRIQKNILTEQEQKRQELELKLVQADRKATEAKNRELELEEEHLRTENNQLKEYADYLDKNEDELRRFKHDYQTILNSLKVSAREGNTQKLVEQLDNYTNTQFDQKALRKYKDVNHIHISELKSIIIVKLAKMYNLHINYSFGCDKDIYQVPKNIDILDISRIIGIAFDNAIEESEILVAQTGNKNAAKVDAMCYQENGDFEFTIRNRVHPKSRDLSESQLSQEGYTTKENHSGIGLSNVKRIAHKYEDQMFIEYGIKNNKFTFNLIVLADESGENK